MQGLRWDPTDEVGSAVPTAHLITTRGAVGLGSADHDVTSPVRIDLGAVPVTKPGGVAALSGRVVSQQRGTAHRMPVTVTWTPAVGASKKQTLLTDDLGRFTYRSGVSLNTTVTVTTAAGSPAAGECARDAHVPGRHQLADAGHDPLSGRERRCRHVRRTVVSCILTNS